MGLFDFFSNKPTPSKIRTLTQRMLNEHHQQQVRQEATDALIAFATDDAIAGLVERLGVNFKDTIKNEQEKRYVSETLVNTFGKRSVEPLTAFIRKEQTISAAILTLAQLVSADQLVALLIETLKQYRAEDHRTISARLQLIDALTEYDDERIIEAVAPYCMDHDDDVRGKVMELLEARVSKKSNEFDLVVNTLVDVLEDPEASGRVTRRAADVLISLDADLSAKAKELNDYVPDGYQLNAKNHLERL